MTCAFLCSLSMGQIEGLISSLENMEDIAGRIVLKKAIPKRGPSLREIPPYISQEIRFVLELNGIQRLYSHQEEAIEKVLSGRDCTVSTPTASGKSLIYNIPVIQRYLEDRSSKALYLFPLKALQQDQLKNLRFFISALEDADQPRVELLDGDTPQSRRRRLKASPPDILITNPDMLHLSILPYHASWSGLLRGLRFVVIDEVHTYRGIMGSNMAWVFRRLHRILDHYGAHPNYIMCSATIGNPEELSKQLIGRDVEVVKTSGSPSGKRFVLFLEPSLSPVTTCLTVLEMAIRRGLKTIVYTQSRKLTELVGIWISQKGGALKRAVRVYRAGLLPEERRKIEEELSNGTLLGVVSTSALELGIDVGALDCSILLGYPGSIMATWQRWGRAGRKLQDSLVVLIAQEDALDHYILRHPETILEGTPEAAILNPENPKIVERHLECAASELPLRFSEPLLRDAPVILEKAKEMLSRGLLVESHVGGELLSQRRYPQRLVDLRGTGQNFRIVDGKETTIGEIDEVRAMKETHPGAIYLHGGRQFEVLELDLERRCVKVRPFKGDYFTRPLTEKETIIMEEYESKALFGAWIHCGRLKVKEVVVGYEKRSIKGQRVLGRFPLDLPPNVFETEGIWIVIPSGCRHSIEKAFLHFMGGIHAIEHAIIGVMPLFVLCDRSDIGGISQVIHPQLKESVIFVYDGVPGGIGLSKEAFRVSDKLVKKTFDVISGCECELGCPLCVHSPKCGSGNRPIDKAAAVSILREIMGKEKGQSPTRVSPHTLALQSQDRTSTRTPQDAPKRLDLSTIHYGVFDLETQLSARDVGGWHNAHLMRVSCAVLYDSREDEFSVFMEDDVEELIERLLGMDLVVGFNIERFDYQVLSGYTHIPLRKEVTTLDILKEVKKRLGYRLSLDHLATSTLGAKKAGNGLLALKWWRERRLERLINYCREDVRLTRDLFVHGHEKGYLLFKNKAGQLVRLPVKW